MGAPILEKESGQCLHFEETAAGSDTSGKFVDVEAEGIFFDVNSEGELEDTLHTEIAPILSHDPASAHKRPASPEHEEFASRHPTQATKWLVETLPTLDYDIDGQAEKEPEALLSQHTTPEMDSSDLSSPSVEVWSKVVAKVDHTSAQANWRQYLGNVQESDACVAVQESAVQESSFTKSADLCSLPARPESVESLSSLFGSALDSNDSRLVHELVSDIFGVAP